MARPVYLSCVRFASRMLHHFLSRFGTHYPRITCTFCTGHPGVGKSTFAHHHAYHAKDKCWLAWMFRAENLTDLYGSYKELFDRLGLSFKGDEDAINQDTSAARFKRADAGMEEVLRSECGFRIGCFFVSV